MRRQALDYGLSILILLGLWQLASWGVSLFLPPLEARVLPGPVQAIGVFQTHWKDIGLHFVGTSYRLLSALGISILTAVPLGLVIGYERWARRWLTPLVYIAYPIPKVVFWPIIFMLLGPTALISKIVFIVLVIFFQLLVSVRDAAANLPKDYILSALAAGVNRRGIYWHVVLPGALPAVFSGLRISLGLGIFAVYLAETVVGGGESQFAGLGFYINNAFVIYNFEKVFAGILAITLLGLALYLVVEGLEHWLCHWKNL